MRTLEEAVSAETRRYVRACENALECRNLFMPQLEATWRYRVHIHALTLKRLRHRVVTPHEAVCAATLSTHAYSDLDGYGR